MRVYQPELASMYEATILQLRRDPSNEGLVEALSAALSDFLDAHKLKDCYRLYESEEDMPPFDPPYHDIRTGDFIGSHGLRTNTRHSQDMPEANSE